MGSGEGCLIPRLTHVGVAPRSLGLVLPITSAVFHAEPRGSLGFQWLERLGVQQTGMPDAEWAHELT